jgi:hypothetical protein
VHILIQLVRICDTRTIKGLSDTDKCPEGAAVDLSNDVFRDAETSSMPASRDLASDSSTELEGLRNEDTCTLLQLSEPLPIFPSPNVTFLSMLELELLGFRFGNLNRFKVMDELDLLIEDLLIGVVATKEFRFY